MQGWQKRFRLFRPDFADRFKSGFQNVIIHLRSTPNPQEIYVVEYVNEGCRLTASGAIADDVLRDIQNQPMLTNVVEFVQQTKSFVSARIRLYSFDEFYRARMNQLFYSFHAGFIIGAIMREREIHRSKDFLGCIGSERHNELVGEMVESSNQVADHVSSSTQSIEGDIVGRDKARRALERAYLSLSPRDISVELIEGDLHVDQILFGPLDLGAD